MDDVTWIKWLIGGAAGVFGWWNAMLHGRVIKAEEDSSAFKVKVSETYASRGETQALFGHLEQAVETMSADIKRGFERIYDKLDSKADKT